MVCTGSMSVHPPASVRGLLCAPYTTNVFVSAGESTPKTDMYVVCQRSTCSSACSHVRSLLISCMVVCTMRHNQNRLSLTVFTVRSSMAVIVITGPGGCQERWDPGAQLCEDVLAKGLSLLSLSKKGGN